ncbi:TniQ family protein [Methylobacterium oryzae]|uniref:TniQ family protein n=1 Tax=Methylobacterium oryzae TaxID=334852 RepID=UPI002F2BBC19
MRLDPVVPFMSGETPDGFVSRLARLNRIAGAARLCADLGVSYNGVLGGRPEALARVAELVGMDPAPLHRQACIRDGDRWTLRGQSLAASSLFREARRVCPACLQEDQRASALPSGLSPYFRTLWHIAHVRACPVHAVGLVELPRAGVARAARDFSVLLTAHLGDLDAFAETAVGLAPTPYEAYLIARLDGTPTASPWLDAMPFHVAARACEMVGSVAVFGRRPGRRSLGEVERHRAGAAGFEVLRGGPGAFGAFLAELRMSATGRDEGPKTWFGDLHDWLRDTMLDKELAPVRQVVVRDVAGARPMRLGERVLGQEVERPALRSVRTVHKDTGLHTATVRRVLTGAGHLAAERVGSPAKLKVAAAPADRFLRKLQGSLVQRDLIAFLGLGRGQTAAFLDTGLIAPLLAGPKATAGRPRYAQEDGEDLLRRLRGGASEMASPPPGCVPAVKASRQANTPIGALLRHILEGRLPCAGWSRAAPGFQGIFVDLAAAKALCRGADLDGYVPSEVQKMLGVTNDAVNDLIAAKLLPTVSRIHPVKRYPIQVVPWEAFARFQATYVKLFDLSEATGVHHVALKATLDRRGVVPALAGEGKVATFYRWIEVPANMLR